MARKIELLSPSQARKIVLLSQRLPPAKQTGSALAASQAAIEHLGYVQIDTISVVQRAHHHTLWNRNPRYKPAQIDQLVKDKKVFEYWSHAAAYLPMCDFRYSLPRKAAIAGGEQNHWFIRDELLMKEVMARIAAEGPLMAKDFDANGNKTSEWSSKPYKQALENLSMQGDLMIPCRRNFHKVYDLTERVLPDSIDTSMPEKDEYARFLISRYLKANGLGQVSEICYLLKGVKSLVSTVMMNMIENGELREIRVGNIHYLTLPASLELLQKPLARNKLKILSPFDNLLIQRNRMKNLFDFDYLLECYVPEAKRRYGYFSLPLLWDGRLLGRMDCRADKKESVLHIHHLALEPGLLKKEAFSIALVKELGAFLDFNRCTGVLLHKTTPESFRQELQLLI